MNIKSNTAQLLEHAQKYNLTPPDARVKHGSRYIGMRTALRCTEYDAYMQQKQDAGQVPNIADVLRIFETEKIETVSSNICHGKAVGLIQKHWQTPMPITTAITTIETWDISLTEMREIANSCKRRLTSETLLCAALLLRNLRAGKASSKSDAVFAPLQKQWNTAVSLVSKLHTLTTNGDTVQAA